MGRMSGARPRARFTAMAAAAVALLAGCTGTPTPAPAQPATTPIPAAAAFPATAADDITPHAVGSALDFECENPIGASSTAAELAGSGAIGVADLMYISFSGKAGESLQWGEGASYQGLYFAKVGLALKAGAAFTVEVPEQLRGQLKIGWSNSGYTLADSLAIAGCTSTEPDAEWLVYPGGFWLDAPACIPLTVKHGESVETIHIPIGTSCP